MTLNNHQSMVRIQVSAIGMKEGRLRPRIDESIPRLGGEGFPPELKPSPGQPLSRRKFLTGLTEILLKSS